MKSCNKFWSDREKKLVYTTYEKMVRIDSSISQQKVARRVQKYLKELWPNRPRSVSAIQKLISLKYGRKLGKRSTTVSCDTDKTCVLKIRVSQSILQKIAEQEISKLISNTYS